MGRWERVVMREVTAVRFERRVVMRVEEGISAIVDLWGVWRMGFGFGGGKLSCGEAFRFEMAYVTGNTLEG